MANHPRRGDLSSCSELGCALMDDPVTPLDRCPPWMQALALAPSSHIIISRSGLAAHAIWGVYSRIRCVECSA